MFPTQVTEWQTRAAHRRRRRSARARRSTSRHADRGPAGGSWRRCAAQYPALATGAQIPRYGSGRRLRGQPHRRGGPDASTSWPSTPADSRGDGRGSRRPRRELLVVAAPRRVSRPASDAAGPVAISVPARSSRGPAGGGRCRCRRRPPSPCGSARTSSRAGTGSRRRCPAATRRPSPSSCAGAGRATGRCSGTDDARPFRVFVPPREGPAVEVAAVVNGLVGQRRLRVPLVACGSGPSSSARRPRRVVARGARPSTIDSRSRGKDVHARDGTSTGVRDGGGCGRRPGSIAGASRPGRRRHHGLGRSRRTRR